ncbi:MULTISPECIES: major tail protein [unclassified Adlercreutzia]|uniref:major tail protein n=1 Tax=unclassified Adlercreutzia TaxID=2636013 RepID=UPI0013EAAB81|nr:MULTISPECIES: major tail protein [unclassified Adlercreutzia]
MANLYKYGFAELHVAFATEEGYETPISIPNVLSLTLDPEGSSQAVYGDDSKIAEINTNNGYTGSVNADVFPDDFLCEALGWYKDNKGKYVEVADGKPRHFAMAYRIQGDEKNRRTWCYDCLLSRPSKTANGVQENVEPDTDTLNLTVVPKHFADIDKKVVSTWCYEGDQEYADFYKTVVLPAAETPTTPTE